VLESAVSDFELRTEFPSLVEQENDCRGCPALEKIEEIRNRRGREEVDTMLEGLVRALEKNLRTSDQALLRPCGQVDVVLASADERTAESVLRRLGARMKEFWGPHVLEISSAVTIREGKKGLACDPVMRRAVREDSPNDICGETARVNR
jgi:hypothetical protein